MQFALVSRDILFLNFNINAFGEHIIHLNMLSQPNIAFGYQCRGSNWMLYLCTSIVNLYNLFKHMVLAMIIQVLKAMLW